jgi:hypothetical protein
LFFPSLPFLIRSFRISPLNLSVLKAKGAIRQEGISDETTHTKRKGKKPF